MGVTPTFVDAAGAGSEVIVTIVVLVHDTLPFVVHLSRQRCARSTGPAVDLMGSGTLITGCYRYSSCWTGRMKLTTLLRRCDPLEDLLC
jgi:hypothetical protein